MKRNHYTRHFVAICPVNGQTVRYTLSIETAGRIITVEDILKATTAQSQGLHEDIADELVGRLGGEQTLCAYHHGVFIETQRGEA